MQRWRVALTSRPSHAEGCPAQLPHLDVGSTKRFPGHKHCEGLVQTVPVLLAGTGCIPVSRRLGEFGGSQGRCNLTVRMHAFPFFPGKRRRQTSSGSLIPRSKCSTLFGHSPDFSPGCRAPAPSVFYHELRAQKPSQLLLTLQLLLTQTRQTLMIDLSQLSKQANSSKRASPHSQALGSSMLVQ